ncbi:MAK10-like protein [Tanacetum coccineum]|uniref:MAK10-like protein n=1 Tax=Tanacetum coccineum TaxID=301880 RepID=A0ABQ4WV49_9ASTR
MGDENPIRTLGDYSKPSHEGYRNTIELPEGNNVVPLRSDTIRKRTRLHLFQFSLRDQASNWLERLPAGFISIWEDLTTRFLAQFFPPRRISKLRNDILMFQQHHGESLSEAWNHVPSTSDHRLIELKNQVQRLMEAHLAPTQHTQVNKITTSCKICSGPHDTQYCMENPEQAFVKYASSRTDEAGEGLVSEFMASQDARLSKFEAAFKQQQSEMTNKINTVLKAIADQIAGTLPSDTVKNPKLGTHPVSSARDDEVCLLRCPIDRTIRLYQILEKEHKDISSIIDPRLSQVVLGRPFVEISNMTHDPPEGVVRFIRGDDEGAVT